jgi:hypothetical protein
MTANGKATLVPIAIMINGKFYDATAYKAAPVPMALEPGTVYEGERTGKSIGLFTVSGALRSRNPDVPTPWLGAGSWLPAGAEAPATARKAENVPKGIEGVDDGPPRLARPGAAPDGPPTKQGGSTTTTPAPSSSTGTTPPPATQNPRGSPQPGSGSSPAPSGSPQTSSPPPAGSTPPTSPPASPPGSTNPSAQKPAITAPPDSPRSAPSDSGASESGRPVLRRGKPTAPLPEDDIPGYGEVNSSGVIAQVGKDAKGVGTSAPLVPTDLVPAISDAGGPQPHSFAYEWEHGEERDQSKQMLGVATDALRDYLKARAKSSITAKPSGAQAARSPAPKAKDPVFEGVKLRTFDLWGNEQPVMVLTAEAHFPAAPGRTADPITYSITVAARTDIYNNLHKLYAGITDKFHLDVTPRLELIDAVDADGDGRGELLFRTISDIGTGYVVYRATSDTLWKMFDSQNAQ